MKVIDKIVSLEEKIVEDSSHEPDKDGTGGRLRVRNLEEDLLRRDVLSVHQLVDGLRCSAKLGIEEAVPAIIAVALDTVTGGWGDSTDQLLSTFVAVESPLGALAELRSTLVSHVGGSLTLIKRCQNLLNETFLLPSRWDLVSIDDDSLSQGVEGLGTGEDDTSQFPKAGMTQLL